MMSVLDLLALVSGCIGVFSFLLTLFERFSAWRGYILPLSWGFGGLSGGLIVASFIKAPGMIHGGPSIPTILCILLIIAAAFLCAALLKHHQALLAYFIFLFSLLFGLPQLAQMQSAAALKSALEESAQIPAGDFLLLAAGKQRLGDISGAILYLGKALQSTNDPDLQFQIDRQIKALRRRLADSIVQPQPGS